MAKKHFCKKLNLGLIPCDDIKEKTPLSVDSILDTNAESTCHVSFKDTPHDQQDENPDREWGLFKRETPFELHPVDLDTDTLDRKVSLINYVARSRSEVTSYDEDETTIQWSHRDKSKIFQKRTLDPEDGEEKSCERLQKYVSASKCETFPSEAIEIDDEERECLNNKPPLSPMEPDFSDYLHDPEADLVDLNLSSQDKERSAVKLSSVKPEIIEIEDEENESLSNKPPLFPLEPDFSDYVQDPEVDLVALNISRQDRERTAAKFTSAKSSSAGHRSVVHCLPKDVRKKLWPNLSDSDSPPNTESSDTEKTPYNLSSAGRPLSMRHNLNVLKRKPFSPESLSAFREKVREDLSKIHIEEPKLKKPKIEKIEWDLGFNRPQDKQQGRRDVISEELKRLRLQSDNSNDEFSPVKRRVVEIDNGSSNFIPVAPTPTHRRIVTATRRRPHQPPNAIKIEKADPSSQNRLKLVPTRKSNVVRRCRLCGEPNKNLRSHICLDHLGREWWGVVGDLTCWTCQRYHTPSEITKCNGSFIPLFNKETLIARHVDFMANLMEEFGVKTPFEVLLKVKRLGLNTKCASEFTDREVVFLEILDSHYGFTKKDRYSARYPSRVVEILHWKTISEIFCYLREAGNLRGTRRCNISASVVDTRCDILTLRKEHMYEGPLSNLDLFQKDLKIIKLEKVIGEVHDPNTPITSLLLQQKDPMVRLALGVTPQHAHEVKPGYYIYCKHQSRHNSVVAIGGLGLDRAVHTSTCRKQHEVMIDFMKIAKNSNKAVRLLSTGDMALNIHVAKQILLKKHPIHLLNYSGGPEEIEDFLSHFENGFIGISSKAADPNPRLLSTIERVPLNRFVVESNCPHQAVNFHAKAKPTDVVTVMNIIARIKCMDPVLVSRVIRTNVTRLYHF